MINSFRGEYGWLSNMFPCKINYKGHSFISVENAYMWEKCPNDESWLKICLYREPNAVKRLSSSIELISDWDYLKKIVMLDLLRIKFNQEPFKTNLIATGDQNIQEGNAWNDKFWGVCLKSDPNEGENHLGRIIMKIRNEINNGR